MKAPLKCLVLTASALLLASEAFANPCPPGNPPTNCAPPPGWILDLAGGAVPNLPSYNNYTVNFTATAATTNVSFAFREDPAFLYFDDVSVHPPGWSFGAHPKRGIRIRFGELGRPQYIWRHIRPEL